MHWETVVFALGIIPLALAWWIIDRLVADRFSPRIFISYRRKDEEETQVPKWLWKSLSDLYGPENVFLDEHSVAENDNYPPQIMARLDAVDVILAVIGPYWHGEGDGTQCPRIIDPDDWVRREVETGLRTRKLVVVKAGNRQFPKETDIKFQNYAEPEWRTKNALWVSEDRRAADDAFFPHVSNTSSSICFTIDNTVFDTCLVRLRPLLRRKMPWRMRYARLAWQIQGTLTLFGTIAGLWIINTIITAKNQSGANSDSITRLYKALSDENSPTDESIKRERDDIKNMSSMLAEEFKDLHLVVLDPITFEEYQKLSTESRKRDLIGRWVFWQAKAVKWGSEGLSSFQLTIQPLNGGEDMTILVSKEERSKLDNATPNISTIRFLAPYNPDGASRFFVPAKKLWVNK